MKRRRASTGGSLVNKMIERCAERVDVGASVGVNLVAAVLFKRRVQGSTHALDDRDRHFLIRSHDLDEAEIDQLEQAARA